MKSVVFSHPLVDPLAILNRFSKTVPSPVVPNSKPRKEASESNRDTPVATRNTDRVSLFVDLVVKSAPLEQRQLAGMYRKALENPFRIMKQFEDNLAQFLAPLMSMNIRQFWEAVDSVYWFRTFSPDNGMILHFRNNGIVFPSMKNHETFIHDFQEYLKEQISKRNWHDLCIQDAESAQWYHLVDASVYESLETLPVFGTVNSTGNSMKYYSGPAPVTASQLLVNNWKDCINMDLKNPDGIYVQRDPDDDNLKRVSSPKLFISASAMKAPTQTKRRSGVAMYCFDNTPIEFDQLDQPPRKRKCYLK